MAQGLRSGYRDVYAVDTEAHTKSVQQLSGMFAELNRTRRALAHPGRLTDADEERMEVRVRDWLRVVGCLALAEGEVADL